MTLLTYLECCVWPLDCPWATYEISFNLIVLLLCVNFIDQKCSRWILHILPLPGYFHFPSSILALELMCIHAHWLHKSYLFGKDLFVTRSFAKIETAYDKTFVTVFLPQKQHAFSYWMQVLKARTCLKTNSAQILASGIMTSVLPA